MRGLSLALSAALFLFAGFSHANAQWQEFAPPATGFRDEIPGPPKVSTQEVKTKGGVIRAGMAEWGSDETLAFTGCTTNFLMATSTVSELTTL